MVSIVVVAMSTVLETTVVRLAEVTPDELSWVTSLH